MVLLTGGGSIDLAVRAIKEGAEQFLTKPVDLPALAAVLKRVAEARRAQELQGALNERQAHRAPGPLIRPSAAIPAPRGGGRRGGGGRRAGGPPRRARRRARGAGRPPARP